MSTSTGLARPAEATSSGGLEAGPGRISLESWVPRVHGLVERTPSLADYRLEVMRALRDETRSTSAWLAPGPPITKADGRMLKALRPIVLDRDVKLLDHFVDNIAYFRREVGRAGDASLRARPWVDADIFAEEELRKLRFWRELMEPDGVASLMVVPLVFQGEHFAAMTFFRRKDLPRFRRQDAERLEPLVPLLVLGDRLKQHAIQGLVPANGLRQPLQTLTAREQEVARLAASGLQNKAIAVTLGLSPNTVRNTLSQVFEKLEVTTRTQLAAVVFETTIHG